MIQDRRTNPLNPGPRLPLLHLAETPAERALKEAQMLLEGEAIKLSPNARRGALLELAGEILRTRGRLEQLLRAA